MQSLIARASLLLLLVLGPICAIAQSQSVSASDKSHWNKLLKGEDVFSQFQTTASGRARVIVSLVTPDGMNDPAHWQSLDARKSLRKSIHSLQQPVLDKMNGSDLQLRHRFENQAGFSAELSLSALEELLQNPKVASVEPVRVLQPHLAQGIALMNGMTYRSTFSGAGVSIAICDSGIDYWHSRLGGAAFPNSKVIGGYNFGDGNYNPYPQGVAHGTACAGIAAGNLGTYGDYIGGVAPGAKLYSLKITAGSSDGADNDTIIAAWNWCVSHQFDDPANPILVVSTSYGGTRYYNTCDGTETAFKQAADNLENAGITVLCSSGNDGYCDSLVAPACISTILSVGSVYDGYLGTFQACMEADTCATLTYSRNCVSGYAVNETTAPDKVAVYCNIASFLSILAPADKAYTTDITGSSGYSSGDYMTGFGGTSAACPYAAGAVAQLQSAAHAVLGRYLSPPQVRAKLTASGDWITDTKSLIRKPRVNLGRTIDSLSLYSVKFLTPTEGQTIAAGATEPFSWLQTHPASEWFYVYINRNGSKYMEFWCPASKLSSTNIYAPGTPLPGGSYAWWIRPWSSSSGFADWSAGAHFSVESCIPNRPAALSPQGTTETSAAVTYTWKADACAALYDLYVMRNGAVFSEKWCKPSDLTASNGQVSFVLGDHKSGAYTWWVRAWSADGLGPWSSGVSFSVSNQPPATVSLLVPGEGDTLTNWVAPEFAWTEANPAASWYCLKLNRNSSAYVTQWIERMNRCALTNFLPAGNYSWSVQPWNPEGFGPLSSNGHFSVAVRLPAAITLVAPSGTTSGGLLDYTWVSDSNATWYELYVTRNGALFLDKWYSKDDLAGLGAGQVTAHITQGHGSGTYRWWVRGWGPDGMGPWSSTMSFSIP